MSEQRWNETQRDLAADEARERYESLHGKSTICMNGHKVYTMGCVSCVLLHKKSEVTHP